MTGARRARKRAGGGASHSDELLGFERVSAAAQGVLEAFESSRERQGSSAALKKYMEIVSAWAQATSRGQEFAEPLLALIPSKYRSEEWAKELSVQVLVLANRAAWLQSIAQVLRPAWQHRVDALGALDDANNEKRVSDAERETVSRMNNEMMDRTPKPYQRAREIAAKSGIKQRRVEYLMGLRRKK